MMRSEQKRVLSCRARRLLSVGLLLSLVWGLAGCRSRPSFGASSVATEMEAVKLRPGLMLKLSVLVAGKEEINEPAKQVSDAGTIVLPLLGKLTVAGMTLDELRVRLTGRYKKYFIDPEVSLDFVRDTTGEGISPWGFVTVLGRVREPGQIAIPATRDMTVSGAIQQAGGLGASAKVGGILVTRTMPDGKTVTRSINLYAAGAAGRLEEDIVLEANDVVFVPESMF